MRSFCRFSLLAILLLPFASCGGGGGGGSSSSATGVRVLHGAIDAAPVDLLVDSDGVVQQVKYGDAGAYHALGGGIHSLMMVRAKDLSTPLFSRSIASDGEQKFTILLHGDRQRFGLLTNLITEQRRPEPPSGFGLIRIIHGAIGAGGIEGLSGSTVLRAEFGGASEYQAVSPGVASFRILRSVDATTLGRGDVVVEEGRAYTIFVAGEVGYLVTIRILDE